MASARADLAEVVEPGVVEAATGAVEMEQTRLMIVGRGIVHVLETPLGHRHVPRL